MDKIRLVIVSTDNVEREEVVFTNDFESAGDSWCSPGQSVTYDKVIEDNLPGIFPINYTLRRT
jgi:hypothetical protein